MKTELIIEKYDNGIALKSGKTRTLALDVDKARAVGNLILDNIPDHFAVNNVVKITMEYEPIKEQP